MTMLFRLRRMCSSGGLLLAALWLGAGAARSEPLRVVATVPDLGSLIESVGGEEVSVRVLVKGPQDPHFIEPRPSFIRLLHDADLYAQVGLGLEAGWAPTLLRAARNPAIQPGAPGHFDASSGIAPLERPTGPVDRSQGDVHPYGNPHYLLDPVNGLHVARRLRERLSELRPEAREGFEARYAAFARLLVEKLLGSALARERSPEAWIEVVRRGALAAEARASGRAPGGWLGALEPHFGVKAVEDHRLWAYFARRFGIVLVETLEPKPGIAPTARHLERVVQRVRDEGIRLILTSPYFDLRHARWVAERSGARIVALAHQPGAREGTDGYLETVDYNVRAVLQALGGEPR